MGISIILFLFYLLLGMAVDKLVDNLPDDWAHISHGAFSQFDMDVHNSAPLQLIVDELAVCANITHPIKIGITQSAEVNAFALPNGQIVVYSGLLDAVKSENGLTFVLAHELSHFKNRDHLRQMGRGVILTGLFALLTGDNSGFNEALTPAMLAGNASYSQARESEADIKAMEILNCHYGHVGGATELFEFYRDKSTTLLQNSFLSSHPAPQERIENIVALIANNNWSIKETVTLTINSELTEH